MTKPLPSPNVQVTAKRFGPPRLTPAEQQALEGVEDPALRKVLGEIFLTSRGVQENFDEIRQWFPIQPEDAANSLRRGTENLGDYVRQLGGGFRTSDGESEGAEGEWLSVEEIDAELFAEEGNVLRVDVWAEHTAGTEGEKGEAGEDGKDGRSAGLKYVYSTNTEETDPGAGKLKFNKAKLSEATSLRISETDGDGNNLATLLATFDDSTTTGARGIILLRKAGSPAAFAGFQVTGALTDKGEWDVLPIAALATGTALANNDEVTVEFYRTGDKGEAGPRTLTEDKEEGVDEGDIKWEKEGTLASRIKAFFSTATANLRITANPLKKRKEGTIILEALHEAGRSAFLQVIAAAGANVAAWAVNDAGEKTRVKTIVNTEEESSFLQFDVEKAKRRMARGTAVVEMEAAFTTSPYLKVKHGLGAVPVVIATSNSELAGVGAIWAEVRAINEESFEIRACRAATPGKKIKIEIGWMAVT